MSGDYYKEWRAKAEVDYFPQLVILWLSTNSWYPLRQGLAVFLWRVHDDLPVSRNNAAQRITTLLLGGTA